MCVYIIGRAKRATHWGIQSRFRVIYICVCRFVYGKPYKKYVCQKCVGEITWPKHAHAQSLFWAVKTELKANRASEIEEQRKERLDKTRK